MALWLMKYFPGVVKTERQAGATLMIIMGVVLLAMAGVLFGNIRKVVPPSAYAPASYGANGAPSGAMPYHRDGRSSGSYPMP
jgi:hypothetical protein